MALRFLALAALCMAAPTAGGTPPEGLTFLERARVAFVIDGDTLALDDGRRLRLLGIDTPELGQGEPVADRAKEALEQLAPAGAIIELFSDGATEDRYRRLLAHIVLADGRWLQRPLLERGLARVASYPDNRALVPEMLALEAAARAAGVGLWGEERFALRDAADPASIPIGRFELVEGMVAATEWRAKRVHLHFGADRAAFTAVVLRPNLFLEAGIDPMALAGRRVRVRGWTRPDGGPRIDVSHPERLEILE